QLGSVPSGYSLSPLRAGGDRTKDNDFYGGPAWTDYISVTPGMNDLTWDCGLIPTSSLPGLSVNDVSVTEGNAGTTYAYFTVSLSAASTSAVTASYYTYAGTATQGTDYAYVSGTVTIPAGQTAASVSVPVYGDTTYEPNETFYLYIYSPTGATITRSTGTGTILDADPAPSVTIGDVSVTEGNSGTTTATFTLTLSAPSGHTASVYLATASGTATSGTDFTAASGTVTFSPGQTTKTFTVNVTGDATAEPDETYYVNLSAPSNLTLARTQAVGTILNDDAGT